MHNKEHTHLDGSRKYLENKIADYQIRKREIDNELEKHGYNEDLLRERRNIKMHIVTCKQRINGDWRSDGRKIHFVELKSKTWS